MVDCDIRFDQNPFGIYFAGQTVNGQVVLTLPNPKKVRGICLKISGFALCEWSERHHTGVGKNRRTRTVHYQGREDYLSSTTYLAGSESAQQTVILPGIHTYSFSCTLPNQLPSSFEGAHGHVRYTVRVALERPWKFDQTYRVAFTVLKHFDLNYDSPALRIPSQAEVMKTFCCGPCKSPPMIIRCSIPQSGFVPGQIVVVSTEVKNNSTVDIVELIYSLRKIVYYHSQPPNQKTKEEIVDVCEQRRSGLESKSIGWFNQEIQIPAIPPTLNNLCRVININYEVKVEVKVKGAHMNPVIRIPITIGTMPLANVMGYPPLIAQPTAPFPTSQPEFMPHTQDHGPRPVQPITTPILAHRNMEPRDLPPPSYEETVGTVNINDNEEDLHPIIGFKPYAPRYPVYNLPDQNRQEEQPSFTSTSSQPG